MTRTSRHSEGPDTAGDEPMLEEMATFRRLLALETAPPEDKQRVFVGARREILARPEARAGWKLGRPWGIALLALGTSTALAATPPGRELVSEVRTAVSNFLSADTKAQRTEGKAAPLGKEGLGQQPGHATPQPGDAHERDARAVEGTASAAPEEASGLAPLPDLPVGVAGRPAAAGSKLEGAKAPRPATQAEREARQLEAEERKLVEQARFALGQKRYQDAQLLSAEHRRRFPDGKLAPERNAIERQVTSALGGL